MLRIHDSILDEQIDNVFLLMRTIRVMNTHISISTEGTITTALVSLNKIPAKTLEGI